MGQPLKQGEVVKIGDKKILVEKVIAGKGIEGVDMNTGESVFVSKKEMIKEKQHFFFFERLRRSIAFSNVKKENLC